MVSLSKTMQRFELNEDIDKPLAEVWRFLTEPYFASHWMKDVEGVVKIGDEPITKGTKLKSCRRFVGRRIWTNFEVTQFEENKIYELFSDDRDVRSRYTYSLRSEEDGSTHLQLVVEYKIQGFASFFSGVFDKLIEEHETDHLLLFKQKIEPEVEPDYSPKVVHVSEIMPAGPGTVNLSSTPPEEASEDESEDAEVQASEDEKKPEREPRTPEESEIVIEETVEALNSDKPIQVEEAKREKENPMAAELADENSSSSGQSEAGVEAALEAAPKPPSE